MSFSIKHAKTGKSIKESGWYWQANAFMESEGWSLVFVDTQDAIPEDEVYGHYGYNSKACVNEVWDNDGNIFIGPVTAMCPDDDIIQQKAAEIEARSPHLSHVPDDEPAGVSAAPSSPATWDVPILTQLRH